MFFVHMMASGRNGTLYVGQTDDLWRRVTEHRTHALPGFTDKYAVSRLAWYEGFESRDEARWRERSMKKWRRAWKLELIERFNPGWRDLFEDQAL
jgi:putative endonuclease